MWKLIARHGNRPEDRHQLHGKSVRLRTAVARYLLNLVAYLEELMTIRPVTNYGFVRLAAGVALRLQVTHALGYVPPRMKDPAGFPISSVLPECGNNAIIHLKFLPFAVHIQRTMAPLNIDANRSRRKFPRRRFSRKEVLPVARQIRTTVRRHAHTQALPDGVTSPAGPVS